MDTTLLILAAGMGRRYGGLKQMDKIGPSGESILDYSIYDAIQAGYNKVVFVIREAFAEEFKKLFDDKLKGKIQIEYAYQEIDMLPKNFKKELPKREKPWGTAHAILAAQDVINEPFVVINADDFYGPSAFLIIKDLLTKTPMYQDMHAMVAYKLKNTLSDFGSVSRGVCTLDSNGFLMDIVERSGIYEKDQKYYYYDPKMKTDRTFEGNEVVSMNFWGFKPNIFDRLNEHFLMFLNNYGNDPMLEFYIPSFINSLILRKQIRVKVMDSREHWFGVTYKQDKKDVIFKVSQLIEKGKYPDNLWDV